MLDEGVDLPRAVCALIFSPDGHLLAVSRRNDQNALGLPGGKVDPGESDEDAIIREVREETGIEIHNLREIYEGVCDGDVPYETVCFIAEYSGEPQNCEDGVRVVWASWYDVLTQSSPFSVYNQYVHDVWKHLVYIESLSKGQMFAEWNHRAAIRGVPHAWDRPELVSATIESSIVNVRPSQLRQLGEWLNY